MKAFLKGIAQVLFFVLVSLAMNALARELRLPVPGSILGVFLVFILLRLRVLRIEWLELGAKWLLAEMLLFFIPSAAGVIKYQTLLLASGPRILLVIVCSTAIVMAVSGIVAQALGRRKGRAAG